MPIDTCRLQLSIALETSWGGDHSDHQGSVNFLVLYSVTLISLWLRSDANYGVIENGMSPRAPEKVVTDTEALNPQGLPPGPGDEALEAHLASVPPPDRNSVTRSRPLNQSFIFCLSFPPLVLPFTIQIRTIY